MLGLRFCARAFSSCSKPGPLFIAVRWPLTIAASLVEEHRLQTRRLSSCGSRAQLLRGMWDLPRPGLEPVSPALAGRFSTAVPPGKPSWEFFAHQNLQIYYILWVAVLDSIIRMDHNLLNCSPLDGHLGYFQVLRLLSFTIINISIPASWHNFARIIYRILQSIIKFLKSLKLK